MLHREEDEADECCAVDLTAPLRDVSLLPLGPACSSPPGWRALPLLLAPSAAGRRGEAGGQSVVQVRNRARGRREARRGGRLECGTDAEATDPKNAACRRLPLILQQKMQHPLDELPWRLVMHFGDADAAPAGAGDGPRRSQPWNS
jgi:hypothetical protein